MNPKRQHAAKVLNQGGLLVYPTEAVYGLGCLAKNENALAKLRKLKSRQDQKGLIVLCASVSQMEEFFPELQLSRKQLDRLQEKQQHPTTWLIPFPENQRTLLTGGGERIAIRITDHPLARELCELCGPIVSSSANQAGQPTPDSMAKVREIFGTDVDYYLDAPLGGAQSPSQIIDLLSGEIIRSA